MVALRGAVRLRRFLRHWRPIWAAGLCAASFATGQLLFGDDAPTNGEGSSLLSQYRQATSQMVEEAAAIREPAALTTSEVAVQRAEIKSQRSEIGGQPSEGNHRPSEFEGRLLGSAKSRSAAEPSAAHSPAQAQNPQSQMSHLRSTAVQTAKNVSLIEAKPLPRSEVESPARELSETHASAAGAKPSVQIINNAAIKPSVETAKTAAEKSAFESPPARKPLKEITPSAAPTSSKPADNQVVAKLQPTVRILRPTEQGAKKSVITAQSSPTVDEQNLPPIVPAWAVPRPGTKKRANAAGTGPNPPTGTAAQSSMRIELGASPPRSPAPIVLSPESTTRQTPNAIQPINSPATLPATPVQTPPAKDDQRRSDGLWQRPNDGSPFLKPVTYLSDATAPSANAPAFSDAPQRLPPTDAPQSHGTAQLLQEPRLLPMPLEIANPYIGK